MLDLACLQIHHALYQVENLGKPSELIQHYNFGMGIIYGEEGGEGYLLLQLHELWDHS